MIRLIVILEDCHEEAQACAFDYDTLPKNVRKKVDKALESRTKSCKVDIYEDGLQYLYSIKHPRIESNSVVEFLGVVKLYNKD